DQNTRDAVVIDPVLDFDPLRARTRTDSVEQIARFLTEEKLRLHYVLETHAHADHLSGSQYLKRRFDARVAIGERIQEEIGRASCRERVNIAVWCESQYRDV